MNKPRIFLGSSGKQEKLLRAITHGLQDVADVEPWTTTFNPGRSTLDRLVELSQQVDFAAFVEFVAFGTMLDVLKAVGRVCARTPDTCIGGIGGVGDMCPHHRHGLAARDSRKLVDVIDLARIGFVSCLELVDPRIGFLEIDIDDGRAAAEAEFVAGRVGHHFIEYLPGGFAIREHSGADDCIRTHLSLR